MKELIMATAAFMIVYVITSAIIHSGKKDKAGQEPEKEQEIH